MAACDLADTRTILKALPDDRRLLLDRPGSPASYACEDLEPMRQARARARALRHLTML